MNGLQLTLTKNKVYISNFEHLSNKRKFIPVEDFRPKNASSHFAEKMARILSDDRESD
jgi:hypothetical protein